MKPQNRPIPSKTFLEQLSHFLGMLGNAEVAIPVIPPGSKLRGVSAHGVLPLPGVDVKVALAAGRLRCESRPRRGRAR